MTDLTEWIKERRTIHGAATEGPWEDSGGGEIDQHWSRPTPYREVVSADVACMSFCYGGTARGILEDEDSTAIVDAHNTLPALLTAVEKVLELHVPDQFSLELGHSHCEECNRADAEGLDPTPWPCPTVDLINGLVNDE